MAKYWNKLNFKYWEVPDGPHEANLLKLDCSKANSILRWTPVWNSETCFKKTVNWYKSYYENNSICSQNDLLEYVDSAIEKKSIWTQ